MTAAWSDPHRPRPGLRALARAPLGSLLVLALLSPPAQAHRLDPIVLEIDEQTGGDYLVAWSGDTVTPRFAPRCRWSEPVLSCGPGGLAGTTLGFAGIEAGPTEVVVVLERADGSVVVHVASERAPLITFAAEPSATAAVSVVADYVDLGARHIFAGVDHLAFLLALLLLVSGPRRLLATVTGFTLAHSLTLAAVVLGWVSVAVAPVEAAIAASIVMVAAEACRKRQTVTRRAPYVAAIAFGLLHGFGFAGGLTAAGLPADHVPAALLGFNVGVELGQLAFVAVAIIAARLLQPGPRVRAAVAYAVGTAAFAWTIERVGVIVAGGLS